MILHVSPPLSPIRAEQPTGAPLKAKALTAPARSVNSTNPYRYLGCAGWGKKERMFCNYDFGIHKLKIDKAIGNQRGQGLLCPLGLTEPRGGGDWGAGGGGGGPVAAATLEEVGADDGAAALLEERPKRRLRHQRVQVTCGWRRGPRRGGGPADGGNEVGGGRWMRGVRREYAVNLTRTANVGPRGPTLVS